MKKSARSWLGFQLIVMAAAVSTGCTDSAPLGPDPQVAAAARVTGNASSPEGADAKLASSISARRAVDLGQCDSLQVPAGHRLASRVYAQGVQIYHWNGASWSFAGPSAVLSADADGRGIIGTHYSGPTWESLSGSKVVGTVLKRCQPDPGAIQWLLLGATASEGPGRFDRVTFIQRVNTVGGNAPSAAGTSLGQEARVPYTTEYLFYRAQ